MFSFVRCFRALALAFMLALGVNAVAWADDHGGRGDDVAEFDLNTVATAFALLSGGALVLSARRKNRKG